MISSHKLTVPYEKTKQKIRGQTVDKTMTKPVVVVKNQEKPKICNKAL